MVLYSHFAFEVGELEGCHDVVLEAQREYLRFAVDEMGVAWSLWLFVAEVGDE